MHGTLEIFAIIVAGAAGIVVGNSILFPGSYARTVSFARGVRKGAMVVFGLMPVFLMAAFFEGFVTRYTTAPYFIRFGIAGLSVITSYSIHYTKLYDVKRFLVSRSASMA